MRSQSEQYSRTDQERGGESDRTNSRQATPEMDASNEEKHEEDFDQRAWWCTSTAKVKKETRADDFGSSLDVINLVSDNEETVDSTQVDGGTEVIEERLIPVAETIEIISAAEAAAEQNDAAEGGEEVATEERVSQNEDPQ